MNEIKLGKYKHYKGQFYVVMSIARDSGTLKELVVYKGLYDSDKFGKNPVWVRPKKEFLENVNLNEDVIPRFVFVGEE
jgi:hypothetical protein